MSSAALYAAANPGAKVVVEGVRAATLLSTGQSLIEQPQIGRQRAEKVALALREIGVAPKALQVRWRDASKAAKGVDDFENRRVDILVTP